MFMVLIRERLQGIPFFHKRICTTVLREREIHFALLAIDNRTNPNWKKIRGIVGDCRERLVPGAGILLPEGFREVDTLRYDRELLKNGLKFLCEAEKRTCQNKMATLIDLDSRYQDFAGILLQYFGTLHIVTRTEGYRWFAERSMEQYGAAVTMSASLRGNPALLVSPEGILPPEAAEMGGLVATPAPPEIPLRQPLCSFRAKVPVELERFLPRSVDAHLFQAAVYEYCGQRKLGKRIPDRAAFGGKEAALDGDIMNFFHLTIQ